MNDSSTRGTRIYLVYTNDGTVAVMVPTTIKKGKKTYS